MPSGLVIAYWPKEGNDVSPFSFTFFVGVTQQLFDLLTMYLEDTKYALSDRTRGDIGRMDVSVVIEQIYGYLAINRVGQPESLSNHAD